MPEQMQRVEILGPMFENAGAQPFRLVEIALLEARYAACRCKRDRFGIRPS